MDNEARLVEQARHDPEAFAALYDHYVERIYAYAQRETGDTALAQDMVSATFEKALKNLPRYQWRGTSFGAWLYKIARNEINMARRKQKWTIALSGSLLGGLLGSANVEQQVQITQEKAEVRRALTRLPARDQEVLRLRYFEELSHAEIAEILNGSTRNVAVRLHRALKRLRKQMERDAQEVVFDVTP